MLDSLESRFAAMSDDEMLAVGAEYSSLTDEAQAIVRSEFKRRSLEVPSVEDEQPSDALAKVATIRQYRDQADALMARSVLESAGIGCYLRDENTIRIDWLWSNLMGGIRLQVAEEDVEAAEQLLSQPIPETIAVAGEFDYQQPQCPQCGSLDASFNNFDAKVGAVSILILGFPLPSLVERDYWHCDNCGCNWFDEPEEVAE
jgi:hypothetical protein